MREYLSVFEKLANHIEGLFDVLYMSCFINGLKDEIWYEAKMFCPSTMMESLGFPKLVEDKIIAQ